MYACYFNDISYFNKIEDCFTANIKDPTDMVSLGVSPTLR